MTSCDCRWHCLLASKFLNGIGEAISATNWTDFKASALLSVLAFLVAACGHGDGQTTSSSASKKSSIEISNVLFRSTPEIRFYIRRLTGKMLAEGAVVNFDDPASFVIQPDEAEIAMNMEALAALMNGYILNSPQAQVKAVKLRAEGDRLHIAGSLKKGVTVPFEAQARVSASNDGSMQIAIEKFSGAKIPMKGFLNSLGLNLDDLVSNKGTKGMRIEGDNLIIDPEAALPPPRIRGKLTQASIVDQKLVLTFGQPPPPRTSHAGYLWIRGGTLRFGRLEMTQADLKMIGLDAKAPFDFDMREYNRQLIAGYSKTTPSLGLEVHMPNHSSLSKAPHP